MKAVSPRSINQRHRLLAIDPGAERCGWALLEPGPTYIDSGVFTIPRKEQPFQKYRLQLEEDIVVLGDALFAQHNPDALINEIIPAVGGGNFAVATQSYLANCVVTVLHALAYLHDVPVKQISSRTVQKDIGVKGRTGKVSKAGMRNGVLRHFPSLVRYIKDNEWPWDRWDAIGVGLAGLGCVTK